MEPGRINDYQVAEGVTDALDYVDRYDEEIAYMDAEIGRLLAGYAQTADLDALPLDSVCPDASRARPRSRLGRYGNARRADLLRRMRRSLCD